MSARTEIKITAFDDGRFGVEIREGEISTFHRVTVPADLGSRLGVGVGAVDEERLVRESFEFLLEREPPTSILSQFSLDQIARYFGDYYDWLRGRLEA